MDELREWYEELSELIKHPDTDDPQWILNEVKKMLADERCKNLYEE